MVEAEIVEADRSRQVFWLAKEKMNILSSDGRLTFGLAPGANRIQNVNPLLFFFSMFSETLCHVTDVAKCFPENGPNGIPTSKFSADGERWVWKFSDHMTFVENFTESLPQSLCERFSRLMFLDVGCGTGGLARLLAAKYTNGSFYGIDLSPDAISEAIHQADVQELPNVFFEEYDAAHLPPEWSSKFDWLTAFHSIQYMAHPEKALDECYRVLRPGGFLSLLIFNFHSNARFNRSLPRALPLYTISLFRVLPLSLHEGEGGLGMTWGKELAKKMLQRAGFLEVVVRPSPRPLTLHLLAQKPRICRKKSLDEEYDE